MANLARWDPFRDLMSIQSELNRLFGRAYVGEEVGGPAASWLPAMDVHETKDAFVMSLDLPGVDPEAVEVSVEDSTLTVKGERRFEAETSEEDYIRVERRFGSFARTLSLPSGADPERIEASFDRGVLTISVQKAEETKPRKIAVKAKA